MRSISIVMRPQRDPETQQASYKLCWHASRQCIKDDLCACVWDWPGTGTTFGGQIRCGRLQELLPNWGKEDGLDADKKATGTGVKSWLVNLGKKKSAAEGEDGEGPLNPEALKVTTLPLHTTIRHLH